MGDAMKKKRLWTRLLAIGACALWIFGGTALVLNPKNNNRQIRYFLYGMEQNTVDVGFFGGSHGLNAFCPNILWQDHRIRAVNYCTSGQPLFLTYYVMVEALKAQKLQVAVVDVYYAGLTTEWYEYDNYLRWVLDYMEYSDNWVEAVQHCVAPADRIYYYYLSVLKYHASWAEFNPANLKNIFGQHFGEAPSYAYNLGWAGESAAYGADFTAAEQTDSRERIPEKSLEYLQKIIELCQQNDIRLILTSLPHDYQLSYKPGEWVSSEYALYNSIGDLATAHDVPFLRFNGLLDELSFDERVDMYNNGHCSIKGALKISAYLGDYIQTGGDVSIPAEADAALWETYYARFSQEYAQYL